MTGDRCRVCESPLHGTTCSRCDQRIARPDLLEPPPGRGLGEALVGLRLAVRGARLTLRTPRLLVLVVLPLLLSLTLFAIMVALVWEYREIVRPDLVQTWPWGLDWLRRSVVVAAEGLGVLIGVGIAVIATVIASQVINAPFLEWLSVAVESIVLGRPDRTPFSLGHLWRTSVVPIFQAMGLAVVQAFFGLLFLVASMLAVTAPLAMLGGLWLVALSLCDLAIARKGLPVRERFRRVRGALPLYLGLALPFFLAPFLLPLGAAGATLADLRQRASVTRRDSRLG